MCQFCISKLVLSISANPIWLLASQLCILFSAACVAMKEGLVEVQERTTATKLFPERNKVQYKAHSYKGFACM